jgi:hypothetical protein
MGWRTGHWVYTAYPMLFQSTLRPLDWVEAFGLHPPTTHWFGLTDGCYWLTVGDTELFRYSQTFLADGGGTARPPYVDYYVVRLWEDVLEALPDLLDPLPDDIAARIATPNACRQWTNQLDVKLDRWHGGEVGDWYDAATLWWRRRLLDSGHLRYAPHIWWWRQADTIHLAWDTRDCVTEDGVPVWSATAGATSMTVSTFLEEVRSFNQRLMEQMRARVAEIQCGWSRTDLQVDVAQLVHEHHHQRLPYLTNLLAIAERGRGLDIPTWDQTRQALNELDARTGAATSR